MDALTEHGPRLHVMLFDKSESASITLPTLIDTGADMTAIDEQLITQLRYEPVGTVQVITANGSQDRYLYDVVMKFPREPGSKEHVFVDLRVAGLPRFGHDQIQGLLGRDLLKLARLEYDGPTSSFALRFPRAQKAAVGVAGFVGFHPHLVVPWSGRPAVFLPGA